MIYVLKCNQRSYRYLGSLVQHPSGLFVRSMDEESQNALGESVRRKSKQNCRMSSITSCQHITTPGVIYCIYFIHYRAPPNLQISFLFSHPVPEEPSFGGENLNILLSLHFFYHQHLISSHWKLNNSGGECLVLHSFTYICMNVYIKSTKSCCFFKWLLRTGKFSGAALLSSGQQTTLFKTNDIWRDIAQFMSCVHAFSLSLSPLPPLSPSLFLPLFLSLISHAAG